ncbi:TPA: replication factor C large subunit [Candidatus Micrarchaeota archaeon]|nr:replication factor C large subunit [Candidatus Micrarchaeota archaeon]
MLFFIKYSPQRIDEIIGNEEARTRIRQWLLGWDASKGKRPKPILVHGPTGTGKTSFAYALKREYELELIEMGSSDLRNREHVERVLGGAAQSGLFGTLSGKKRIILIDDVDALQSADTGGGSAITRILKEGNCPVILTATNPWDKKLSGVRAECELVQLRRVSKPSISKILRRISEAEKLNIADEVIISISENASGDVRAAINDLQARSMGTRDREVDIFNKVRSVFKAMTYADAKKVSYGNFDYDIVKLWIDENIPLEYEDTVDMANAYLALSQADIFDGRIKRSHWGYFKYSIDFVTAGVSLSKKEVYRKFTRYQFPSYLREMGATVARRAMRKEIGKKIGSIVHANRKDALEYLPLIRGFCEMENGVEGVMLQYKLSEEEIAFINGVETEKIKKKNTGKSGKEGEKEAVKKEDAKEELKTDNKEAKTEEKKEDETKHAKPKVQNTKLTGDTKLHEFF